MWFFWLHALDGIRREASVLRSARKFMDFRMWRACGGSVGDGVEQNLDLANRWEELAPWHVVMLELPTSM